MINVPYLTDLQRDIELTVRQALAEDLGHLPLEQGDITASIISREDCVFCCSAWLTEVFRQLSAQVQVEWFVADGDKVTANSVLCELTGPARILLTGERTALNFIQSLSGTATTTALYVSLLEGSTTRLLDTRKTLPGMRLAQKYAVACG